MQIVLPNNGLTIEIPGTITIIDNLYSRKLEVVNMFYNISNKSVEVHGVMKFFDSENNPVNNYIAKSYAITISADNSDFCDVATGIKLCAVEDEYLDEEHLQLNPILEGIDYMKQFDWFFNIGATQPIIVNNIIQSFLLDAISKGLLD